MTDIRQWLESLGLGQYADAFEENAIDQDTLLELDHELLKEVGVKAIGHRVAILKSIQSPISESEPRRESEAQQTQSRPPAIDEAERRQLTVMFADLVGSTELSQKLDPEDLQEVIRAYQDTTKAVIEQNGGFVARYMGDGVLAYFGYPQAHEDDTERSIRAGIELAERIPKLGMVAELAVRVGIATGPVVVGEMIGEGASRESSVVGETPNLAARLQSVADSNRVVISERTRQLVGARFELEALAPRLLKGIGGPVPLYVARREFRTQSRFAARTGSRLTPLVGREEEVALLEKRWATSQSGQGQIVLVTAEAGMGKSRLVEEIRDVISGEQQAPSLFQCSQHHENSAFHPVLAQLESSVFVEPGDEETGRLDRLRTNLLRLGGISESAIVLIARLLGLVADVLPPELRTLDSHDLRERTLNALVHYVITTCEVGSGVCIFEDVHWADPSSLELIDRLAEACDLSRCLVLVTSRPGFVASWIDLPHCSVIHLSRLGSVDSTTLARTVVGSDDLPTPGLLTTVIDRAGGNPLFIEELARALSQSEGQDAVEASRTIPATLHDSLMGRLDALGSGKSVAQCGCVLGREFDLGTLRSVWDGNDETLTKGLEELQDAGLLFSRTTEFEEWFQFKHALVQDTAYGSLLRARRSTLHERAARALLVCRESLAENQPELLAHHLTEAHQHAEAIAYWYRAGERAIEQSSYQEGATHLRRGLQIVRELKDDPMAYKLEADLLVTLGPALLVLCGYSASEVGRTYERLRTLYEQHDDLSEHVAPTLQGLRLYSAWRGDLHTGELVAAELLAYGRKTNNALHQLEGHKAVAILHFWQGRLGASKEHFKLALAIAESSETERLHHLRYDADSRATCLSFLSWNEWALGFPQKAEVVSREAVTSARDSGHHFTLGEILAMRCWLLQFQGRFEEALSVSKETQELALERDFPVWHALASLVEGSCFIARGDGLEGLSRIEQALRVWSEMGYVHWLPHHYAALAVAHERVGDLGRAQEFILQAAQLAVDSGELLWMPELKRLEGHFLIALDRRDEAEQRLQQAISEAREQGSKLWELRAARDLARLLSGRSQMSRAFHLLAPVYGSFTEGFDTADLEEAKILLDELS
jgi:class 3 adenylate cyclase/tetratricopeptide (TPR) repeat protein